MRIASVAKELGVSADWLRRLEQAGAIPKAQRDRNGHRRFSDEDLGRLRGLLFETPTVDAHEKGAGDG